MKSLQIFFLTILLFYQVCGQEVPVQNHLEQLKIGSVMPNIPLGKVLNSTWSLSEDLHGKLNITDFKGKLVILDFWDTACSTCLEGFPKMSELQKKFDGKVQIFLVNPWENEHKVVERLTAIEKRRGSKIIPENLPMLVDAKRFLELFPIRSEIGYHVWIDLDGRVTLRGISENTTEKKIQELLAGKSITFLQDNSGAYNGQMYPFFISKNDIFNSAIQYSSSFSRFIADHILVNPYGNGAVNIIDSTAGTIRNTQINTMILHLYNDALRSKINDSRILYGPRSSIEITDTSLIILHEQRYESNQQRASETDEEFYKQRFCYEQIVPLSVSESDRKEMMLQDINRYFSHELGISGGMEEREISGLLLKVTNPEKLLKSHLENPIQKGMTLNGRFLEEHQGVILIKFLRKYISKLGYHKLNYAGSIIDDLDYSGRVDLILPPSYDIQSIEELKGYLNKYGIDLVPGKKIVEMLVVKDVPK